MKIQFDPPAILAARTKIRAVQTDCLGYHPPEMKNLCGACVAKALTMVAETERERCALYLEKVARTGFGLSPRALQDLASQLRRLE
ncbi:MAG: hypothetical protein WC986_14700 [Elusimicrobiota bacterium]|jgi:hypothetical protein